MLKFYLTSLEPNMDQKITSQSIGGYCSESLLYPEAKLSSSIGLYDEDFSIELSGSSSWDDFNNVDFLGIGGEMLSLSSSVDGNISVNQRAYNGVYNIHLEDDIVTSITKNDLFNDSFSDNYTQYRCLALKNTSGYNVAENVIVYFKVNSLNSKSNFRVAIEVPKSKFVEGSSSEWTSMTLIDSDLAGIYSDNHFADSYLVLNSGSGSGQGKLVQSYDGETGTFTFYSSFSSSYNYDSSVDYYVEPSPSQRINSGIVSPEINSEYVTAFFSPENSTGLGFYSHSGSVFVSESIYPNDVIYLWLERKIEKSESKFDNNSLVIDIRYNRI